MKKDFWPNSTVLVIGAGSFGTVLCNLAAENCSEVRVLVRSEERSRMINVERTNADYLPGYELSRKVKAFTEPERAFSGGVHAVVWALPSDSTRSQARENARYLAGSEVVFHATKGVEKGSLKRISEVLKEELPCSRIGVISGPNLAAEIAKGQPAATVIASAFDEVTLAGQALFRSSTFRVYGSRDMIGLEWAGTLKNVLAIASGCLDGLGLGMNSRAMLISRGLAEMVRFGTAMGAKSETFMGLAGIGDLIATSLSPLSRNYRVGEGLAKGETLQAVLERLGSTAEGINTALSVWDFAQKRGIKMPITEAVCRLVQGEWTAEVTMRNLLSHPYVPGIS